MGEIGESHKIENKWISNGSWIPEKWEINGFWLTLSIEIDFNMENPIKQLVILFYNGIPNFKIDLRSIISARTPGKWEIHGFGLKLSIVNRF